MKNILVNFMPFLHLHFYLGVNNQKYKHTIPVIVLMLMKRIFLLSFILMSVSLISTSTDILASTSPERPDSQDKYDSAQVRVENAIQKIEQIELMIRDGKGIVKEESKEKKQITKEISALERSHKRNLAEYEDQLKSKDKDEREDAKNSVRELKATHKTELKELKNNLKECNKKLNNGKQLMTRGKTKLKAAKDAKKRAMVKLKVAKKKLKNDR